MERLNLAGKFEEVQPGPWVGFWNRVYKVGNHIFLSAQGHRKILNLTRNLRKFSQGYRSHFETGYPKLEIIFFLSEWDCRWRVHGIGQRSCPSCSDHPTRHSWLCCPGHVPGPSHLVPVNRRHVDLGTAGSTEICQPEIRGPVSPGVWG